MDNQIYNILNDMSDHLNVSQMKKLQEVLIRRLEDARKLLPIPLIWKCF